METATIFDIQHFCIHDGDGIRTTVFFKGCPLRCKWCHNPESISYNFDLLYNPEKCTACGECIRRCKNNAITMRDDHTGVITDMSKCTFNADCVFYCVNSAREVVGRKVTVQEIVDDVTKDMVFYQESKGGVTLSGGEPLMQIDFVEALLKELKKRGINTAIDTSGKVPFENIRRAAAYADTFLYDLKAMNEVTHIKFMGVSNKQILDNLRHLADIHKGIHIRMPIVKGVNDNPEHTEEALKLIKELGIKRVSLLPYHDIAAHKYTKLGKEYEKELMEVPSAEYMESLRQEFENNGLDVTIGG